MRGSSRVDLPSSCALVSGLGRRRISMFQQRTSGPAKRRSPIFAQRQPLMSVTGLSSRSGNQQKQQRERPGVGSVFQFGAGSTAANCSFARTIQQHKTEKSP